jgi:hypothetical protein
VTPTSLIGLVGTITQDTTTNEVSLQVNPDDAEHEATMTATFVESISDTEHSWSADSTLTAHGEGIAMVSGSAGVSTPTDTELALRMTLITGKDSSNEFVKFSPGFSTNSEKKSFGASLLLEADNANLVTTAEFEVRADGGSLTPAPTPANSLAPTSAPTLSPTPKVLWRCDSQVSDRRTQSKPVSDRRTQSKLVAEYTTEEKADPTQSSTPQNQVQNSNTPQFGSATRKLLSALQDGKSTKEEPENVEKARKLYNYNNYYNPYSYYNNYNPYPTHQPTPYPTSYPTPPPRQYEGAPKVIVIDICDGAPCTDAETALVRCKDMCESGEINHVYEETGMLSVPIESSMTIDCTGFSFGRGFCDARWLRCVICRNTVNR